MNSPITVLKEARRRADTRGVIANAYEGPGGRCCLLGYIAQVEHGAVKDSEHSVHASRNTPAWHYVIAACKELLPGWDHEMVSTRVFPSSLFQSSWDTVLPEAIITVAKIQGADDIAHIVYTRAIKLAEADEIAKGRVADEAEVLAHSESVEIVFTPEPGVNVEFSQV